MPSPGSSPSPSRSSISALAIAAVLALGGCGNDNIVCGPEDAPADGVTLTVGADTVNIGSWTSSANNDCPADGHPISLTLDGIQSGGTFHTTFCLPRPDELGGSFAIDDALHLEVVNVSAELDGCTVVRDSSQSPTGTIEFTGYCSDGSHPAGYAIEFEASVPGIQICNMVETPVTIELGGRAAVTAL